MNFHYLLIEKKDFRKWQNNNINIIVTSEYKTTKF